ncbi:hypothetical protein [Yersinia ruckeri]|uniref:hypothetical protein n=1 Tax=Yersinia ruckeri TaxID=29486 RepID=UPI002237D7D1|nr:hypothetical protein [Yersinia ruckeri]MCW6598825.1 hypothetical protein [Yersinia ruckeri]
MKISTITSAIAIAAASPNKRTDADRKTAKDFLDALALKINGYETSGKYSKVNINKARKLIEQGYIYETLVDNFNDIKEKLDAAHKANDKSAFIAAFADLEALIKNTKVKTIYTYLKGVWKAPFSSMNDYYGDLLNKYARLFRMYQSCGTVAKDFAKQK